MSVCERMDAAIERARWRLPESAPKWIYLTDADWAQYDDELRLDWPSLVRSFSYRDVQTRNGRRSRLVTVQGCLVAIPQRLSHRTEAA